MLRQNARTGERSSRKNTFPTNPSEDSDTTCQRKFSHDLDGLVSLLTLLFGIANRLAT